MSTHENVVSASLHWWLACDRLGIARSGRGQPLKPTGCCRNFWRYWFVGSFHDADPPRRAGFFFDMV
ncbi:MAG: hypothetical protein DMG09_18915 [Acidobacteria bacterium]|nr:MAG: hypothetical protein DMG09_18915 [Acidobacteriota bacterium]